MKRISGVCALTLSMLVATSLIGEEPAPVVSEVAWGKIVPDEAGLGVITLDITDWPSDGKLNLPTPFANITRAYLADDPQRKPIVFEHNADAESIVLHLTEKPQSLPGKVILETAEKSEQFTDGRIVLTANDARISRGEAWVKPTADEVTQQGQFAFELGPEKVIIGGWEYTATRPGMYQAEVTYSASDVPEAQIRVNMLGEDRTTNSAITQATKNFNEFTTVNVGRFYVPTSGKISFALMSRTKEEVSVPIRVKAITLRPTCEGKTPQQAEDGTITLHSRDVTIQGVKVQYEPKPEKNTVGYWVNEKDWVYWDFAVKQPGKYSVEILQGCGKGHGGSEVKLSLAGQDLPFTVEDTGHFQNFMPRTIGTVELKAGDQRLKVVPVKKANVAIMDLRQVRLVPVKAEEK